MRIKINYQINVKSNMKKKDEILLKQNNRHIIFKELPKSYVELENILKAFEGNFSIKVSGNNQFFYRLKFFENIKNFMSQTNQTFIISMVFGV